MSRDGESAARSTELIGRMVDEPADQDVIGMNASAAMTARARKVFVIRDISSKGEYPEFSAISLIVQILCDSLTLDCSAGVNETLKTGLSIQ
jgi:hypothetical protein